MNGKAIPKQKQGTLLIFPSNLAHFVCQTNKISIGLRSVEIFGLRLALNEIVAYIYRDS